MEDAGAAELELSPGEKSPLEKTVSQSSIIRRKPTRGSSFAASEGTKQEKTEEVLVAERRNRSRKKKKGHLEKARFTLDTNTVQESRSSVYLLRLAVRFLNSR